MSQAKKPAMSRRDLMKTSSKIAAASALAGVVLPQVHAGENNTIQIALVGCGGRGTGAAVNALSTRTGPVKLVAMADVFGERLGASHRRLAQQFANKVDVSDDRKFVGFDSYQKAIDSLKAGDVVISATPPAFRWMHFGHALQKGVNIFMEKPVTVDGASTRKLLRVTDASERSSIKVGVGLMCRHCDARKELYRRIKDGAIGDITLLRAYRQTGPVGFFSSGPKPDNISELMYQVQRFHSFLWASGGAFSDFLIHNIDECCWMKDAWPVQAKAAGGRHFRGNYIDQNFDTYSVEYTFADGTKLILEGRNIPGCHQEFASYAHGTKGSAIISTNSHTPARCKIFKSQKNVSTNNAMDDVVWRAATPEPDPYQLEWEHLLDAIRNDRPYNEARRGAEASLVTAMGRLAAHTGQLVTRDDALNHEHDLAPDVDKLVIDGPAPLRLAADGKYPVPQPGITTRREF